MDTNLLMIIDHLVQAKESGALEIVKLILNALAPILAAVAVYFTARSQTTVAETAEEVKKIHVAVNSKDESMRKQLSEQGETILELSKELATLIEQERANIAAKEVALATKV